MTNNCKPGARTGRIKPWLPPVLWLLFIFVLSSMSIPVAKLKAFRHQDKLVHFIEYGVLGMLLVRGVFLSMERRRRNYWLCILVAVLYGLTDEFHQLFVPYRTADWMDWVADSLGIFVFAWTWLAFKGERLFSGRVSAPDGSPAEGPE